MKNMPLEDLLDLLAVAGSVELVRRKFPIAGSPNLVGKPVLWKCTLTLPGRLKEGSWICPSLDVEARSARDAAEACWQKLEAYRTSADAAAHRQTYLAHRDPQFEIYRDTLDPGQPPIEGDTFQTRQRQRS